MKNKLSSLVVFLFLITFSACSDFSKVTGDRSSNDADYVDKKPSEDTDESVGIESEDINDGSLKISYLDSENKPSTEKTDVINLAFPKKIEGFSLLSKKTGISEYTANIVDEKSHSVISMIYKDGAIFPHRVSVFKDGEIAIGTVTEHRKNSKDFDIVWYGNGDVEVFKQIPLDNSTYDYIPFDVLDAIGNYQVQTLMVSIRIWDAVSSYTTTQSKLGIR